MVRKKITISLSSKSLELIDNYAVTTGFEARSRVIEEAIFGISELLKYRAQYAQAYAQTYQPSKKEYSQEEIVKFVIDFFNLLSRIGGILDRFVRFPKVVIA